MELLLAWLGKWAERASFNIVWSFVRKSFSLKLLPRSRYRLRLKKKLERMPFLFADMSLNVRDDYVALDVLAAAPGRVVPTVPPARTFESTLAKFDSYPRALIFGEGGSGKTTLVRNLALRCLELRPWQRMFGLYGVLPLYVPLKVVATAAEFPVLEAMLGSDPFFGGKWGLRRFVRMARRGKLVVLLDGYDEMAYTGGFQHVVRELEHILDARIVFNDRDELRHKSVFERSHYANAYEALRATRVYLTSRYEFFEYNSIGVARDVQKWVVKGLEDRRIELVSKIFAKYRTESSASTGIDLNAELFLQELLRVGDEGIVDLSKNPLFLTVMCYVYVREHGSSSVFQADSGELARKCMALLLEDLDRYKSRESPLAEQKAIMGRRSDNVPEKYEFLCYFAVKLYEDERNFFDESYLFECAEHYFSERCDSERSEKIRRGLDSQDPTINIVRQIVLSGLLVLVDKRDGILYLDFPHRKFRETLAIDYFSKRKGELVTRISERQYSELVLAFVEQAGGDVVLDRLVELAAMKATSHVGGLLIDVMRRIKLADAEAAVAKLLEQAARREKFLLPEGILEFIKPTAGNAILAKVGLSAALRMDSASDIEPWCYIAAKADLGGARELAAEFAPNLCYLSLRALMHTPIADVSQVDLLQNFVAAAVKVGRLDEAVGDLIRHFFIGRGKCQKAELRRVLTEVISVDTDPSGAVRSFLESDHDDYPLADLLNLRSPFESRFVVV